MKALKIFHLIIVLIFSLFSLDFMRDSGSIRIKEYAFVGWPFASLLLLITAIIYFRGLKLKNQTLNVLSGLSALVNMAYAILLLLLWNGAHISIEELSPFLMTYCIFIVVGGIGLVTNKVD